MAKVGLHGLGAGVHLKEFDLGLPGQLIDFLSPCIHLDSVGLRFLIGLDCPVGNALHDAVAVDLNQGDSVDELLIEDTLIEDALPQVGHRVNKLLKAVVALCSPHIELGGEGNSKSCDVSSIDCRESE